MVNDNFFYNFLAHLFSTTAHDKAMHLSIYVDADDDLKKKYINAAMAHNQKLLNDPHFYDAGFDLFLPKNDSPEEVRNYGEGTRFFGNSWNSTINKVNFKVKCCARMFNRDNAFFFSPFYTYMRSSMSKTPLRLANNQGIIDAGYRGPLIGMFDCIYDNGDPNREYDYFLDAYSRMLQVCAPQLAPIYVTIVDSVEELGPDTSRGEGGFGSTGK
jgi:dUTP pyrophosphatase